MSSLWVCARANLGRIGRQTRQFSWVPGSVWEPKQEMKFVDAKLFYLERKGEYVREHQKKLQEHFANELAVMGGDDPESDVLIRKRLHKVLASAIADPSSSAAKKARMSVERSWDCPAKTYNSFLRTLYPSSGSVDMQKLEASFNDLPNFSAIMPQHLEDLLQLSHGPRSGAPLFSRLINYMDAMGYPISALQKAHYIAMHPMRSNSTQPEVDLDRWRKDFSSAGLSSLNVLLSAGLRRKNSTLVQFVESQMKTRGIEGDRITAISYIGASLGNIDRVNELVERFRQQGFHFSIELAHLLMMSLLGTNRAPSAIKMYKALLQQSSNISTGPVSDEDHTRIRAIQLQLDMIHKIGSPGTVARNSFLLMPNDAIFRMFAKYYVRYGTFEELLEVLVEMSDRGFRPKRGLLYTVLNRFTVEHARTSHKISQSWSARNLEVLIRFILDVSVISKGLLSNSLCSRMAQTLSLRDREINEKGLHEEFLSIREAQNQSI